MARTGDEKRRIAVASEDGLTVHRHFGRAEQFRIYDVDGGEYDYRETRAVTRACSEGGHSATAFDAVLDILNDCEAVVVAKIGPGAAEYLMLRGMRVFEGYGTLDNILRQIASSGALNERM
ncbi:MAG: dinitrogenase iron-molybdenum cofactor biosynthesis protein [Clostridiales Family XIII bacterium]|jgi:predicted Fe-Mo cluster-binding NifX family protein|nr:dinitrogenase iron-molybdenum cofactor biosynthesis protein [Clostridiales Family XIII bacterium]